MGVKAAIRRKRVGSRVELTTIQRDDESPYWVVPQKMDVATNDEIQAELLSARELLADLPDALNEDGEIASDAAARLAAKTDATQLAAVRRAFVLRLRRGIADHNLDDDDGNVIAGMPDDLIEAILQLPELATEIHSIVVEYNAPLVPRSEMSS